VDILRSSCALKTIQKIDGSIRNNLHLQLPHATIQSLAKKCAVFRATFLNTGKAEGTNWSLRSSGPVEPSQGAKKREINKEVVNRMPCYARRPT
jgi:hypothetical protein